MTRKLILATVACLAFAVPAFGQAYDVLITGGRVIDGTGNPWYKADVAVAGGKIVEIGNLKGRAAKRVIDASGHVVAPGFIDLHTHSEMPLVEDGKAESKVRQGVTLDVLGESSSVAPRDGLPTRNYGGMSDDWRTFTDYWSKLREKGVSMNVISHAAFEQIRLIAVGYSDKPATAEQLERMKALMARSMEEGAWGMVLRFESGGPRWPNEVIELAKVVRRYGGNVTSHIGSEGFNQDKELDFTVDLARKAEVPIHIFHYKIRGKRNWHLMPHFIGRIEKARAEGLDITVNQYPYTAMNHGWNVFFPVWARAKGPEEFVRILNDPAMREKIKSDKDFKDWVHEHGDAEGIVYARSSVPEHQQYLNMRLAEIAKLRGEADPMDTCITLMAEAKGNIGGIFFAMSDENVDMVMKQPWIAISSDAGALNLATPGFPHPRTFGTNVRVLGKYVRQDRVLTLEDAVRKMSSYPAQILGLADRGQVQKGFMADIVVFDPATVIDTATYQKPKSYPIGVPYVLVNGVLVVDKGEHTGARPGRVLYGKGAKPELVHVY